ncbi:hydroxypyruvate isomerase family protein [Calycomorphotria hydatis]|uniref:Hydroxypyruvate isomerase n=1 Tax=Calycomorphotria hydatis TaxID=2528027 RepID=A0A517T5U9_9PLAN|nr:TIM barrel protein [Calycomorphotria hydatis]QDT63744.1 Hydroxypyruvate isomerase [Calycomorphotria hydatis]
MERREFLAAGAAAVGTAIALNSQSASAHDHEEKPKFHLNYAPHFNMFKHSAGPDLIDQLKFMHDHGFRALEDNPMAGRPVEEQDMITKEREKLGMEMGVFVLNWPVGDYFKQPILATGDKDGRERFLGEVKVGIEVAKRVNAKWATVVCGTLDHKKPMGYQTANVVDALRRACDLCEPSGLVMVLEPLNHFTNHPELFLSGSPQAYEVCKAVNHPSCKILFDIYHQQITEGNLIPNIDQCWDEIAYFQVGDNPGRKEPGTGEINYRNVFRHIYRRGFGGVVGMEHGNSKPGAAGEEAVIDAYIESDKF